MDPTRKTRTGIDATRILIYGVTGSGKSTLAQQVSRQLGLPLFVVDDLTYQADWVELPLETQRQIFAEICAQDQWILDSAYGKWLDVPLQRVQLNVGLDLPRWVSLSRLIRRTVRRVIGGELCCNGNRERLRKVLSKDSIIVWHFKSFSRKRSRLLEWEDQLEDVRVIRLRSVREVKIWLASLSK